MSVDYISALNKQGSGLNITQIVDSLVKAETAPLTSQIETKIEQKNQQISGYALIAAELGKMNDYANGIKGSTAYSVSSSGSSVEVSVSDQSQASDFDASVTVSTLASAQTLEFTGFTSKSDLVGTGSLTIDFGKWAGEQFNVNSTKSSQSISIADSSTTLSDLAKSLSSIDGVNATVTNKGDGTYSLIVNSSTGENNALRITAAEDSGSVGLSNFDNSGSNASKQVVSAADAQLNFNGVQISRSSNTITDLIDGYEIELKQTTSGSISLRGSVDADLAYQQVKGFVDMFNSVNGTLTELTKKGINGEEAGVLARDVVLTRIQREIRGIISDGLPGYDDRSRYISELGVKTERDGSISISETDFKKAFEKEPMLFDVMINSIGRSDNSDVIVTNDSDILKPKGGIYDFVAGSNGIGSTLGSEAISGGAIDNGNFKYAAVSGDVAGIKLEVPSTVSSAKIYFGESF
ncbi:flagellar filament capping protein FliD, partial [Paracoccaceae bacterium]|nr:flagellar filament capping protein FliD [Paracoccaceae bacterium]